MEQKALADFALAARVGMISRRNRILVIKGVALAIFIFMIFLFSRYGPQPFDSLEPLWNEPHDFKEIHSRREKTAKFFISFGPYSAAVFILVQALQVVISPIPGELTGVAGGYVFGRAFGFLLSTVGLTLGSWVAFELARILGRPMVERFTKKEILQKFEFLTTNTGATICFLLFLLPGFPKDYLSYILDLSPMSLGVFLVVSTIGRMPGTYLLTAQGASLRSGDYSMAVAFLVIAVAILFIAYLYRDRLSHWIKVKRSGDIP